MPGRDPHGRDHWDEEEAARRYEERERYERPGRSSGAYEEPYFAERGFGQAPRTGPGRRVPRDLSRQADYRTDRGLTPEDREATGGPYTDYGHAFGGYGAGGGYTPTPDEGVGRERRGWDERTAPGSWFGRAPEDSWRDRRSGFFEGPHRGRGPKGYTRSGERIREDVSDRLTDDPHLDASDIEVDVTGTEVTLNGTVDSRSAKRWAEDHAEEVTGVTHVQNNLRVRPRPGTMAAQTDPVIAAVTEGRDADEAARDLREERDERFGRLQR